MYGLFDRSDTLAYLNSDRFIVRIDMSFELTNDKHEANFFEYFRILNILIRFASS